MGESWVPTSTGAVVVAAEVVAAPVVAGVVDGAVEGATDDALDVEGVDTDFVAGGSMVVAVGAVSPFGFF
jgi:hypothetical protein